MKFSINLGMWNSVFAVPTQVVDQHLKLAGGVHLKVLLWLLRHAGTEVDIADISKTLGIGTADIKDAMQYWAAAGLITDFSCDCDHVTLTPVAPDSMPSETHFGLGFAPDTRFALVNHLKGKGYPELGFSFAFF